MNYKLRYFITMLKKIIFILSSFALFTHLINYNVLAHSRNDWLLVNDEISLVEYTDPTPPNLEIREHSLRKIVNIGDTLNFKIQLDKLYLEDNMLIEGILSDGQKFNTKEFNITFN